MVSCAQKIRQAGQPREPLREGIFSPLLEHGGTETPRFFRAVACLPADAALLVELFPSTLGLSDLKSNKQRYQPGPKWMKPKYIDVSLPPWLCAPLLHERAGQKKSRPGVGMEYRSIKNQASMRAYFAWLSMNSRRGCTSSPMSMEKMRSASAALSMVTFFSVRVSGFIVVSQSCSSFISPKPL